MVVCHVLKVGRGVNDLGKGLRIEELKEVDRREEGGRCGCLTERWKIV